MSVEHERNASEGSHTVVKYGGLGYSPKGVFHFSLLTYLDFGLLVPLTLLLNMLYNISNFHVPGL